MCQISSTPIEMWITNSSIYVGMEIFIRIQIWIDKYRFYIYISDNIAIDGIDIDI